MHCSPLVHQVSHLVVKGHQVGQAPFPLHADYFQSPPCFLCLDMSLLQYFSRDWYEADQLVVVSVTSAFLQSVGTYNNYHDFSKIIESGFAMTLASLHTTHACILSGCQM